MGADKMVRVGGDLGLKIYTSLAEIPEGMAGVWREKS